MACVSHLTLLSFLFGLFFLFGKLLLLHSYYLLKITFHLKRWIGVNKTQKKIKHTYSSGVGWKQVYEVRNTLAVWCLNKVWNLWSEMEWKHICDSCCNDWNGINEHFIKHIGINNLMLYFFLHHWKGWLGCVALGGEALAKNTASPLH